MQDVKNKLLSIYIVLADRNWLYFVLLYPYTFPAGLQTFPDISRQLYSKNINPNRKNTRKIAL